MRYSAVVALAGVAAVQAGSSGSLSSSASSWSSASASVPTSSTSSWSSGSASVPTSSASSWSKTGSASASGSGSWSKSHKSHTKSTESTTTSPAGATTTTVTAVSPPATTTGTTESYGTWVTEWETVVETVYVCPTLSTTWTFPSTWTASTETVVVVPPTSTATPATSTAPYPTSSGTSASGKPSGTISKSTGISTPSSCPTTLTSGYEYPHLIVPVSSAQPNTALGTSYNGTITPTISSIFDFDIPASDSGKTCSLIFLFPELSQLETSSYSFNGQGGIKVQPLSGPATEGTTYANQPAASGAAATISPLTAGSSYSVFTGACAAGQRIAYEFSSVGGLDLNFFQDYNPSPLGAYITVC